MTGWGPTTLVGREHEMAALLGAVDEAAQGRPSAVLLAGDAGVGKSQLVAALRDRVASRAFVLGAQSVDLGSPGLPFLAVADLVQGVRRRAAVDPVAAAALERAPVLAALGRPGGGQDEDGDGSRRLQVLDAATTLLAELGREVGPVLVTVEDVQWADASSAAFLTFLLSRLTTERLCAVVTVRTDGLAAHPGARRLVGELGRLPTVRRLDLAPFGVEEVAAYLAASDQSPALAAEVLRRTGGNPYFVATVVADLARTGALPEGVPPSLADLLLGRLEALPTAVRAVLRCASISSQPVSDRMLRRVAGLGDGVLDAALRTAVTEGLLVTDRTGYGFPHELLRAAVLDDLLPGERARLHAARAAALADHVDGVPAAAQVAHHLAEAGDAAGLLAWSVRAADEAMRVPAPEEALGHLEQALETWPSVADHDRGEVTASRLEVQATRAAGLAGESARGVAHARRAVSLADAAGDAEVAVQARAELARRLVEVDAADEAVPTAEEAVRLAAAEGVDPVTAAVAEVTLARALLLAHRPGVARGHADRALAAARAVGRAGLEVEALTTLAFLDEIAGDKNAAAEGLRAAVRQARAAEEPVAELRAHYTLASLHYYSGDVAGALPVLRAAMDRVAQSGLRWSEPGVELRVLDAVALYVSGDLDGGFAAADAPGTPPPDVAAARLTAVSCYPAVALGSPDAGGRVARLRAVWDSDPQVALVAGGCGADLLVWEGDPAAAVALAADAQAHLDRTVGPGSYGGLWLSAIALGALADLAVAARARREADAVAVALARGEVLREHVERLVAEGHGRPGDLGPEGRAWHARALAEHSRLAGAPGVDEWQRALDAFGYGHAYEQARCRWRLAEALVAAGDREAARSAARTAAEAAERMSARPLARAVAATVARDRLAANAGTGAAVLTEREREVLALVAEGLTNREIGSRLFISAKTASVHLSNLMAKLNVSSRTEAVTVARRRGLLDVT